MVDFQERTSPIGMEVLGLHLRRRRSGPRDRRLLGTSGVRRDSGLRAYRDDFDHQRESSLSPWKRIDWEGAGRTRSQTGSRRRNPGARKRGGEWILEWA